MSTSRHYFKWTVNEILQLQREYELLKMNVNDIALSHKRTECAIVSKLVQEQFISSFEEARGYQVDCNETIDIEYDDNESVDNESEISEYISNYNSHKNNQSELCERIGTLEARMEKMFILFTKLTDHLIDNEQLTKNFVQKQYINI